MKRRKNGQRISKSGKADQIRNPRNRDVRENRDQDGNGRNDISWYTKYPILLETTAKFPYPYRVGDEVDFGTPNFQINHTSATIPGVMVLNWAPTIGLSRNPTDPASMVGKQMYDAVRKAFSGSIDADPPDYVTYMLCIDSLIASIAMLKRIYRIARAYTPDSRILPDLLLQALGFTGTDVRANMPTLLYKINEYVYRLNSFTVPAVMDYFNRHYWMNDNVYADAPSINSQLYAFKMHGIYTYSAEVAIPGGTSPGAKYVKFPWDLGLPTTLQSIFTIIDAAFQAFLAWDDCYLISGYLSRAFEGVPRFTVAELLPDEKFTPMYEPEVLTQIENSHAVGLPSDLLSMQAGISHTLSYNFDVGQIVETNSVYASPTIVMQTTGTISNDIRSMQFMKPVFSCRSEVPTVAENVIMSRLKAGVRSYSHAGGQYSFTYQCGSELPIKWEIYNQDMLGTNVQPYPYTQNLPAVVSVSGALTSEISDQVARYLYLMTGVREGAQFDWNPIVVAVPFMVDTDDISVSKVSGPMICTDVHNVTVITDEMLRKVHEVCLYSEFNSFSQM